MKQKIEKAWQNFIAKINNIKTAQNKIIKAFLEEVSKRKTEKIRQKIRKQ